MTITQARTGSASGIILAIGEQMSVTRTEAAPNEAFRRLSELMDAVVVGNDFPGRRNPVLGWAEGASALCFAQAKHILEAYPRADVYVTFSGCIGMPLGMMLRRMRQRPVHVMIGHRLNTRAKRVLTVLTKWHLGVDKLITVSRAQSEYVSRLLPHASVFIPYGVDDSFYHPIDEPEEDYILTVGSESRDFETLMAAISRTSLNVKVVSSSPWCRRRTAMGEAWDQTEILPRVDYVALRSLYQRAKFVVVPLYDVDYAAGVTVIQESLCMGKPLVVSGSRGISDYVSHMRDSYVVPPGNVEAMADALMTLDRSRSVRDELKLGARQTATEFCTLDSYSQRLKSEILATLQKSRVNHTG